MHILVLLKFTPLEFETKRHCYISKALQRVKIYSVGVWNVFIFCFLFLFFGVKIYSVGVWNTAGNVGRFFQQKLLKFTPLEFETSDKTCNNELTFWLKFTPLEFETNDCMPWWLAWSVKIYSVGVWNPFAFERFSFKVG